MTRKKVRNSGEEGYAYKCVDEQDRETQTKREEWRECVRENIYVTYTHTYPVAVAVAVATATVEELRRYLEKHGAAEATKGQY